MRDIAVICLAVILMVGRGEVASAQIAAPDKVGAPRAIGRTGTLSPDEERRAARAHARAASAAKMAPVGNDGKARATAAPVSQATAKTPRAPASDGPAIGKASRPTSEHARAAREMSPDRHARESASDRTQMASRPDFHHPRLSEHARPRRRALAGGSRWDPRVGDVVPRGVLLYPLPPGYQRGDAGGAEEALPGQDYQQPGFPPFPRVHGGAEDE